MMERIRFDALVERIENRFKGRPKALARHTGFWLLLGYTFVVALSVLLIGGGIAVFAVGIQMPDFGIPTTILGGCLTMFGIGQVGALLQTEQHAPQGRTLTAGEAPELWRLVEILRNDIGCPPLADVIITDDFNAAVVQQARLGIFGWPRSWLILGMPLITTLSPSEAASVLAHEFGHISRRHGRQGNRIYQLHRSWEKLFQKLQKDNSSFLRFASPILSKFLAWYWPRFHARAFVLSRQNEFLADQLAADATSSENAASALWRIECIGLFLESRFWKDLWDKAADQPEPPTDVYLQMQDAIRSVRQSPEAERWCDQAMQRVTTNEDSHPSLADRLTAFGVSLSQIRSQGFPESPPISAAAALLTTDNNALQAWANDHWRSSVQAIWKDRHRRIQSIRNLAVETSLPDSSPKNAATLWNETRRIVDAQGLSAAEPHLRNLLSVDPTHVGATFVLGQLRLDHGHNDGEDLLMHVLSLRTVEWTAQAAMCLERHFTSTGRREELYDVRRQLDDFETSRRAAEEERTNIRRNDHFIAHQLNDNELANLRRTLEKQPRCLQAWIVQKRVQHFPEERLYILCIDSGSHAGKLRSEHNDRMITSLMLQLELPGRPFIVNPTGEFRSVAQRMMKQSDWLVYERPG